MKAKWFGLCFALTLCLSLPSQVHAEIPQPESPQAVYQQVQKGERAPGSLIRTQDGLRQREVPLLHWAIRQADLPLVQLLLEKGADIHATDAQGNTPLMLAAWGNPAQNPRWLRFKEQDPGPTFHWRIVGEGFFALIDPSSGKRVYTREGYFRLDQDGQVINQQGYLLDMSLSVPCWKETMSCFIPIHWAPHHVVYGQDPKNQKLSEMVGLSLTLFPHPEALKAVGYGLFEQTKASGEPREYHATKEPSLAIEDHSGLVNPVSDAVVWTDNRQIELLQLLLDKGADLKQKNQSGADALTASVSAGQVPAALYLLRQWHFSQDQQQAKVLSMFTQALHQADFEMVQVLLEQGVQVPEHVQLALMTQAAQTGHLSLMAALQKKGLPLQIGEDETPLMAAVRSGQRAMVQYFLDSGAPLEQTNRRRETPLFLAAQAGHLEILQDLLARGARIDPYNEQFDTPFIAAARNGHRPILDFIFAQKRAIPQSDLDDALIAATERGHREEVKVLLEKGANPKKRDNNKKNALDYALAANNTEIYQMLCFVTGLPTHPEALQSAVEGNHLSLIHELVFKGWNPNQKVSWKTSQEESITAPLVLWAVAKDDLPLVRVLVKHGADLRWATDQNGDNALIWAVWNEYPQIVAYLLQQGVDPNHANHEGNTPLMYAALKGNLALTQRLLKAQANPNHSNILKRQTVLMRAVQGGNPAIVERLLAAGADLKAKDYLDGTAVMMAAHYGQLGVLKTLLSKGASLTDTDKYGWNLLLIAARAGKTEVVKYLLSRKMDPKVKNREGKTALDLARERGHTAVIQLLKGK